MSAPKKLLSYQGDSFGQLLTVNDRNHNLSGDAVCSRGRHFARGRIVLARQPEGVKVGPEDSASRVVSFVS
jgi:hypothetical protein